MKQVNTLLILLSLSFSTIAQQKFKVVVKETGTWKDIYCLIDEKGKLIKQLDTSLYYVSFNNDVYFAIFGRIDYKGWVAIDANEKILFNVLNTSFGEPNPDYLVENKIRIVDSSNKIGFANHKGKIIIKPQFELASTFHNNKAIVGQNCKKIPWSNHVEKGGCEHFSFICTKHGYINSDGKIKEMGKYSFEQLAKKIKWEAPKDEELEYVQ
jgi:hypothetical protein